MVTTPTQSPGGIVYLNRDAIVCGKCNKRVHVRTYVRLYTLYALCERVFSRHACAFSTNAPLRVEHSIARRPTTNTAPSERQQQQQQQHRMKYMVHNRTSMYYTTIYF